MRFMHTKCGGDIDIKTKTCLRCSKHWNWFTWWMTATEIRPVAEIPTRKVGDRAISLKPTRKQYAGWADKVPGATLLPGMLPNWPRWARILATITSIGVIVFLLWWFFW